MRNYNREVKLFCPTCGNDQFESLDTDDLQHAIEDVRLKCSDCQMIYTKKELIDGNQEVIEANIDEVKDELMNDLQKKLKKMFK